MAKQRRVVADPHAELPIDNAKFVKNCTELFLAEDHGAWGRSGTLCNLEVLWLQENRIGNISDELAGNTRLKRLYLHGNKLRSLAI